MPACAAARATCSSSGMPARAASRMRRKRSKHRSDPREGAAGGIHHCLRIPRPAGILTARNLGSYVGVCDRRTGSSATDSLPRDDVGAIIGRQLVEQRSHVEALNEQRGTLHLKGVRELIPRDWSG